MAYSYGRIVSTRIQEVTPPVVAELETVFKELPDEGLLTKLKGPRRRGRPGYDPETLWRCYVVYYVLGLTSVSDLIRTLHDNPYVAAVCGIDSPSPMPYSLLPALVPEMTGRYLSTTFTSLPGT